MNANVKRVLRKAFPIVFWLLVWAACYRAVGQDLLLASPLQVARRFAFVTEASFWRCVGMSLWRTAAAYGLGIVIACVLAVACHASRLLDEVISPALLVVRATPVASFIILALVWLSATNVPILAGILMVVPVVFANVREGISSTDKQLLEMARLFGWSRWKTWRRIVIPTVTPTFVAACQACVGLCFKATIAAEVIGVPKNAIGTQLRNAKTYLETDALLAWTLVVILLSMVIERLLRAAFERGMRRVHHA
ncbi:MAG: ABC transporter permease subunit [Clostridiales bacterium]|nr:ABC transporter permease subunit [Clostridiales bacterium]